MMLSLCFIVVFSHRLEKGRVEALTTHHIFNEIIAASSSFCARFLITKEQKLEHQIPSIDRRSFLCNDI